MSVSSDGGKLIDQRTIDWTIDDSLTASTVGYVFSDNLKQTGTTGSFLGVIAIMDG